MTDHDGYCQCPVLRAHAEAERMLELGVQMDGYGDAIGPLLVGRLRQRYGCRGPKRDLLCPWAHMLGVRLQLSQDVPVIKGSGKSPGLYL